MGNFFEEVLAEELKKQLAVEAKKKAEEDGETDSEEDDDENFIRKDEPQEEVKKTEEKSFDIISKLKNLVFPKNNQQRNLARETGGLEVEKKKESSEKDVWDGRSEEVDKMGSTDVFNTSGMRSVIWKKKREKMAAKHAMDAASAVGVKLKGKVTVQDGIAVVPSQGYVARLKNLRQDHSGLNNDNSGMSR